MSTPIVLSITLQTPSAVHFRNIALQPGGIHDEALGEGLALTISVSDVVQASPPRVVEDLGIEELLNYTRERVLDEIENLQGDVTAYEARD